MKKWDIAFLRRELRLNQHEFAKMVDIPRWRIQLIESGIEELSPKELLKLEKTLLRLATGSSK